MSSCHLFLYVFSREYSFSSSSIVPRKEERVTLESAPLYKPTFADEILHRLSNNTRIAQHKARFERITLKRFMTLQ